MARSPARQPAHQILALFNSVGVCPQQPQPQALLVSVPASNWVEIICSTRDHTGCQKSRFQTLLSVTLSVPTHTTQSLVLLIAFPNPQLGQRLPALLETTPTAISPAPNESGDSLLYHRPQ